MPAPTNSDIQLSADTEKRRLIPVRQAAQLKSISEDSFRRHFSHLIHQITPRRQGVRLGDVLD